MADFLDSPDSEFWIALWEREHTTCPVHHGPMNECPDDERDWYPQRRICWPSAQLAAAKRLFELMHKDKPYHDGKEQLWSETPSRATPFHFLDGHSLYLAETDENPDDDFLSQRTGQTRLFGQASEADESS
ncbi:MAG: hypothetical protein J7518_20465 [Nocardioidaceae bacterium]|nr:hypothetical protein [Nocardioidaceae bacterium]